MPLTNPWLAGPTPQRRLDRERLEERILNLLPAQHMFWRRDHGRRTAAPL